MKCEYHKTCSFLEYTRRIDPFEAYAVEMTYCDDVKLDCMRYCLLQVLERDLIPDNLWPNDESGAMKVLESARDSQRRIYEKSLS